MSELSHYIKLRSGLSGCNAKQFECDKYLDCESCLEDKIKEHDKQIRADAIDDFANVLKENYDYLPQILSQKAFSLYIDKYTEQLKEQSKWREIMWN